MTTDIYAEMEQSALETTNKETNTSIYKLSEELLNKGWKYDDRGIYIPYTYKDEEGPDPREIYLKISRNPKKQCELFYTWVESENENFITLTFFKNDKLINEEDTTFNRKLSWAGRKACLDSGDKTYINFAEDFKSQIILTYGLEVFKELDFEFPKAEEETESNDESENEEETFSFESYPELIREEALKIINDGSLYEKYIKSISITHAGNSTIKEQLALMITSLFIGDPIHTELNADTGEGKTDVTFETVKNIPNKYVHNLSKVSPKNIYYDRESYGEFNIMFFDDVTLSDENIELLKVLSDNNKPVKELKTVIDKKAVTFTLEGKFLVIITYAKNNPDEELLNRLYKLNMIIDKDDKYKIKNKIQTNKIINAGHNEIISRSRQIIQAAIQYLIEQEIEIFNPFTLLFNPNEFENRNISHFISMVKSKSFFHTNKLKTVEFAGKKIYMGSYEDFSSVAKIWSKENDTQKYKLNSKEKKILKILPEKTREQAIKEIEEELNNYIDADTKKRVEIMDKQFTRKKIAKEIGVADSTIRNYLDRSQGTALSLLDKGLIERIKFDDDNPKSQWIYFKTSKKSSNSKKTLWHNGQIEYTKHFNTLNCKMNVIISLLQLANIVINREGYAFLENYCKNKNHNINLNNYDSYYNFINDLVNDFDFNKYTIKLEDAKFSDLTYATELLESLNNNEDMIVTN